MYSDLQVPVPARARVNDPLRGRELLDPAREGPRDPLPPRRDPLLDPLLRESYLERELLMQEIQEMRQREEMRKIEDARRQAELMEALAVRSCWRVALNGVINVGFAEVCVLTLVEC